MNTSPWEDSVKDGVEDGAEVVEDAGNHEEDVLEPLKWLGPTENITIKLFKIFNNVEKENI